MRIAAVLFSVLQVAASGCGERPPPPPPGASVVRKPQNSTFGSSALRQLADEGAEIRTDMGSKWNGVGTQVTFQEKEIGATTLASIPGIRGNVFLNLYHCHFQRGAFTPLNGKKNVEALIFGGTLPGRGIGELDSLPGLEMFIFASDEIEANDLRFLATARGLHNLSLAGTGVNDDVIRLVSRCDQLVELDLSSSAITDEGLRHLESLQRLLTLLIVDCNVTDASLKHVAALRQLRSLAMGGTNVTDAGLGELVSLTHLQFLSLVRTKLTGSGMGPLATLRDLAELNLDGAAISDDGMDGIAQLRQLNTIHLRDTDVTDSGLKKLAVLPDLRLVDAIGTRATPGIRETLKQVTVWLSEDDENRAENGSEKGTQPIRPRGRPRKSQADK